MLTLEKDDYEQLLRLPTPVANPALACFNAGSDEELVNSLEFLSQSSLGFLQALAISAEAYLAGESRGNELAEMRVTAFRHRWKWGSASEVIAAWQRVPDDLPPHVLPPNVSNESTNIKEKLANSSLILDAKNWAEVIESLLDQPRTIYAKQGLRDHVVLSDLEQIMRVVLHDCLGFLTHWLILNLDEDDRLHVRRQSAWIVEFVGPTPRKRITGEDPKRSFNRGLYALVADRPPIKLAPFCQYDVWSPKAASGGRREHHPQYSASRSFKVLTHLEEGNVDFGLIGPGIINRENHLWAGIGQSLARCIDSAQGQQDLKWGLCALRVSSTRELNSLNGYRAVDKLLKAIGKRAATYQQQQSPVLLQPSIYPFFRHVDELVAPFSYAKHASESEVWMAVLEFASNIVAFAHRTATPSITGLKFDIGFIPDLGSQARLDADYFAHQCLQGTDRLINSLKELRHQNPETEVLWCCIESPGQTRHVKREKAFSRLSKASFGIIARKNDANQGELLLRYNHRYQCYNLIGGHDEDVDGGRAEQTVRRELFEEIALPFNSYRLNEPFPCPLRSIEFSRPYESNTCYFHNFLVVDWDAVDSMLKKNDIPGCRWVPLHHVTGDVFPPDVSSFPLRCLSNPLKAYESHGIRNRDWDWAKNALLGFSIA